MSGAPEGDRAGASKALPGGHASQRGDGGGSWHVPDLIRARGSDAVAALCRRHFLQSRRQRGAMRYPLVRRAGCGRSSRQAPDQRLAPIPERHDWKTIAWPVSVAARSGWALTSFVELMCISSTNRPWGAQGAAQGEEVPASLWSVGVHGVCRGSPDRRGHGGSSAPR